MRTAASDSAEPIVTSPPESFAIAAPTSAVLKKMMTKYSTK